MLPFHPHSSTLLKLPSFQSMFCDGRKIYSKLTFLVVYGVGKVFLVTSTFNQFFNDSKFLESQVLAANSADKYQTAALTVI